MIRIYCLENEKICEKQNPEVLPTLLKETNKTFWLDLETPNFEEIALLSDVFHFHPLAIEDAINANQRPKVDEYEGYFFMDADEVLCNTEHLLNTEKTETQERAIQTRQIGIFLGVNYLVTVHIQPVQVVLGLRERCGNHTNLFAKGPDFLLHDLLDTLVDSYFPLLENLDQYLEDIEDSLFSQPKKEILQTIFNLKHALTHLRKHVGPLREVLQTLTTREFSNIQPQTIPYLRDVSDHLYRIYETIDSFRDLTSNMLDAYLAQVNNEMNRIMQRMTVFGAIFLPLTFLTGVFGMNFTHSPWMETSPWLWFGVMTLLAVVIGILFRKRQWL